MNEEEKDSIENCGIRVPKENVQRVLPRLLERGLVTKRFKISNDKKYVYIPLKTGAHLDLEEWIDQTTLGVETVRFAFPERAIPPRSLEDVLRNHFPDTLLPHLPHSWDVIGDILIFELPRGRGTELASHVKAIGEGFMKLIPSVNTVYQKIGEVSGTHRLRNLVRVAGEAKSTTIHRENGCEFFVDVERVFFSPRLASERTRVTADICAAPAPVLDLFSGVGPFSVLIAKSCQVPVLSVDINPRALQLLEKNITLNAVEDYITPVLGDARDLSQLLSDLPRAFESDFLYCVMNLPERATSFLPSVSRALESRSALIYLYSFAEAPNPEDSAMETIFSAIERAGLLPSHFSCRSQRIVKSYAPGKYILVTALEVTRSEGKKAENCRTA